MSNRAFHIELQRHMWRMIFGCCLFGSLSSGRPFSWYLKGNPKTKKNHSGEPYVEEPRKITTILGNRMLRNTRLACSKPEARRQRRPPPSPSPAWAPAPARREEPPPGARSQVWETTGKPQVETTKTDVCNNSTRSQRQNLGLLWLMTGVLSKESSDTGVI